MGRHNRLWTDAFREIAHTKKKFISLLIMNFLAVGFLAGLRMTAPDMKHSLDVYYDEQNLMDVRIVFTLGLAQEEETARELIAMDGVISYNRIDQMRTRFENSIRNINVIIVIIIAAAAILAFLVLFNLTNINVTERIRELATLKVLGFYDSETASYVYRENGIFTFIGAFAGLFMGKLLHSWLIGTVEVDYLMFGRSVHMRSYILAALLTFVFSLSVNFISFFTIKEIDMIESLKSVE